MIRFDNIPLLVATGLFLWMWIWVVVLHRQRKTARAKLTEALVLVDQTRSQCAQEAQRIRTEAQQILQGQVVRHLEELKRVQEHFERETQKAREELEPLRRFERIAGEITAVEATLADAIREAASLRAEARGLLERAGADAKEERLQVLRQIREQRERADALLATATRDAGRIVAEAHARAKEIAGDAYVALREKEALEQAIVAARNIIEGYGDRYLIPSRSVLDDLATHFGFTEAGQALQAARDQTRRMVETGRAAECDYAEAARRETAIRFVIGAFNGRVDAILSRAKSDNLGTLQQEIRDAFSLVNQDGRAFRDARILPEYLDARLLELKWAVVTQELKLREREEQRRIQEQIREEEKVRREQAKAIADAQREEELIKHALDKARAEVALSSASERAAMEARVAELNRRLTEAEAKSQRAISRAQQTRAGNVYIISNIGSFGADIVKIGMTRREKPHDRIWELGDASVPFEFDVHAMIETTDAPALENLLHSKFDDFRVNKVNLRKEFFRLSIEAIRQVVESQNLQAVFTLAAQAKEYRETMAMERMTPAERAIQRAKLREVAALPVSNESPPRTLADD